MCENIIRGTNIRNIAGVWIFPANRVRLDDIRQYDLLAENSTSENIFSSENFMNVHNENLQMDGKKSNQMQIASTDRRIQLSITTAVKLNQQQNSIQIKQETITKHFPILPKVNLLRAGRTFDDSSPRPTMHVSFVNLSQSFKPPQPASGRCDPRVIHTYKT